VAFRKEQEDVEKLEGRSLANYFFQVVGKLDEKLEQERREAYAAKVKLDAAERELAGIEADISEIQTQLNEIRVAEVQYKEELEKKRAMLKASGTAAADQIIEIEQKIAALEAQKREIKEAISAGYSARSTADRILSELESADGWNTWDMFGGGGIITHMAKHSHLDEAQDLVSDLQSKLRRFKTELADIQITANMQVNIDGFLRFADYFFDGLFADWAVGDKISQSMNSVSSTKSQISRTLDKLNSMEQAADRGIASLKQQLDDLIVKAC
jgi:DNA repair exonuclease SbcCD ATPase subunit